MKGALYPDTAALTGAAVADVVRRRGRWRPHLRAFRSAHPAGRAARVSQGLVVIPTDSASAAQVTEVAFALPFTFGHADYTQILTDMATRLGPALGWAPTN